MYFSPNMSSLAFAFCSRTTASRLRCLLNVATCVSRKEDWVLTAEAMRTEVERHRHKPPKLLFGLPCEELTRRYLPAEQASGWSR